MTTVYLLFDNLGYDGDWLEGVYATLEAAQAAHPGTWTEVQKTNPSIWPDAQNRWDCAEDNYYISPQVVKGDQPLLVCATCGDPNRRPL